MLQALLKSKLGPVLHEDMLTGVALGACEYLPVDIALLPFLETARTRDHVPLRLASLGIRDARFSFWEPRGPLAVAPLMADGGEPELLLELRTPTGSKWLLIEAKHRSGKSSRPGEKPGVVTDQLAKYWLHLRHLAGDDALGVVYVTSHLACPIADLDEAERELEAHGHPRPRFFWTHWRALTRIAVANAAVYPLLRDVAAVLSTKFELGAIAESWEWPAACEVTPLDEWAIRWTWPAAPPVTTASGFGWCWPQPRVGREWTAGWTWPEARIGREWRYA